MDIDEIALQHGREAAARAIDNGRMKAEDFISDLRNALEVTTRLTKKSHRPAAKNP